MNEIGTLLSHFQAEFYPVVPIDANTDKLIILDLTAANTDLTTEIINDIERFSAYIEEYLEQNNARYAIGGYSEHRTMYSRSNLFDTDDEPRCLHLGLDIWGKPGTPVSAAMDGHVHSLAFNDRFGDYGATIILRHELENQTFYSLYGHLAIADLDLGIGMHIPKGSVFAHFGNPKENGWWPPHLHIQLIIDIGNCNGDYPGVCRYSEREKYLANCPDPDLICKVYRYV
jgi:peptidoglycan LD-endopeptidase LytH